MNKQIFTISAVIHIYANISSIPELPYDAVGGAPDSSSEDLGFEPGSPDFERDNDTSVPPWLSAFAPRVYDSPKIPAYDTLILAQMWKRSSCCSMNNLKNPLPNCNKCQITDTAADWTIHGLWPTDSTRRNIVEFCPNPVRGINFKNYPSNLRGIMNKFWKSGKHDGNNENFWWHQWQKHGTCAIDIPETKDHTKYFQKTVDLFGKYQVGNMLAKEKISSKRRYDVGDIYKALQKNLGNNKPVVRCIKNEGISYLSEVHLCFTKGFTLKSCSSNTNCDKNVYYP